MSETAQDLLDPAFLARLEKLDFIAKKALRGNARGEIATSRRGAGTLFRDHKNYVQGDDLRFLDWNVYSRLGELIVKQFEAEENLAFHLLLDDSASMDWGVFNKMHFVRKLAAALASIALNRFAVVDFLPLVGGRHLASFSGRGALESFLRVLVALEPGGSASLAERARDLASIRGRRGICVVISDFLDEAGYEDALRRLRTSGFQVVIVQVLDRADLRPDLTGRVRLVDVESPRTVRAHVSKKLMAAYEREVKNWCEGLRRFAVRNEIAHVRLDSSWTLERAVAQMLGAGGVIR